MTFDSFERTPGFGGSSTRSTGTGVRVRRNTLRSNGRMLRCDGTVEDVAGSALRSDGTVEGIAARPLPFTGTAESITARALPFTGSADRITVRSLPFTASAEAVVVRALPFNGSAEAITVRALPFTASAEGITVRALPFAGSAHVCRVPATNLPRSDERAPRVASESWAIEGLVLPQCGEPGPRKSPELCFPTTARTTMPRALPNPPHGSMWNAGRTARTAKKRASELEATFAGTEGRAATPGQLVE